jgi:uncharacterized membrane protein HdeD (DUF308 family)
MAQEKRSRVKKDILPFGKKNMQILLIALAMIVIGYILMAQPPVDSFLSITAAPVILLAAFLVVIPYAIFYGYLNRKQKTESREQ